MRRFAILLSILFCSLASSAADSWSLHFDSASKQFLSDGTSGFEATSDRSANIATWVKFDSDSTGGFCGTDFGNQQLYWYYDAVANNFVFGRGTGSTKGSVTSSTWTPTVGEWVHLAVTHDVATVTFYVNATSYGTASLSGGFRIEVASSFFVGGIYGSWATSPYVWAPFDGEMAGLVLVTGNATTPHYVWSASDVTNIYNSGTIDKGAWSSLSKVKRLYTMEEGTGTTTSNGYSGGTATLSGVTGTPTWTSMATFEPVLILVQ